jgi:hypothetical protein
MDEKELREIVLEKTDDAYITIESLTDEDNKAHEHFFELNNFYNHPQNREIYLKDFREFYLGDIVKKVITDEWKAGVYNKWEKYLKKTYYANMFSGLAAGAGIIFHWAFAIPTGLLIWSLNRVYDRLQEVQKEQQRYLTLLEEAVKKKKEIDDIGSEVLEQILGKVLDEEEVKEKLMAYHELVMG